MRLSELPNGVPALVTGVESVAPTEIGSALLQRLRSLGFIADEPVAVLRRGPGGREPLAVQIGESIFALRLREADCVHVQPVRPHAVLPSTAVAPDRVRP